MTEPATPLQSSDFIRHPAYSKHTTRASFSSASATPAAVTTTISAPSCGVKNEPHTNLKENAIREDRVISPLTQSAQRLPLYVRDSIMTPRCRKPVFTFSPIDEPADDDLAPNVDLIHQLPPTPVRPPVRVDAPAVSAPSDDAGTLTPVNVSSDTLLSSGTSDSEANSVNGTSDSNTSPDFDSVAGSVDSDARSISGSVDSDAPSHGSSDSSSSDCTQANETDDVPSNSDPLDCEEHPHDSVNSPVKDQSVLDTSLTSPFKTYLMGRDIEVCDDSCSSSGEEEDSVAEDSLLDSVRPVTDSLLEFLDGNIRVEDDEQHAEVGEDERPLTSPNNRPLTKSIIFETSL